MSSVFLVWVIFTAGSQPVEVKMTAPFEQHRGRSCIIESLIFIVAALILSRLLTCCTCCSWEKMFAIFSKSLKDLEFVRSQSTRPEGPTGSSALMLCLQEALPHLSITPMLSLVAQLKFVFKRYLPEKHPALFGEHRENESPALGNLFQRFIVFYPKQEPLCFQNTNTSGLISQPLVFGSAKFSSHLALHFFFFHGKIFLH